MKVLLSAMVFGLAASIGCAGINANSMGITPADKVGKPYEYIYPTTTPKTKAYARSLSWVSQSFVSAKAVIEVQDKETGMIIGKAHSSSNVPTIQMDGSLSKTNTWVCQYDFSVRIDVKDNKARIVFSGFKYGSYDDRYLAIYESVKRDMDKLAESYKTALSVESESF